MREDLLRIVDTIPPPTSPLGASQQDEIQGLALLDAGLRLAHVTRVVETLRYVDRFSMSRSVSVDVDLSRLSPQDLEILSRSSPAGSPSGVVRWIPIARHSRSELSSVDVSLHTGELLPRLPQRDCSDLISTALLRILRMILATNVNAANETSETWRTLHRDHRTLWLLERAITLYVSDGGSEGSRALKDMAKTIGREDAEARQGHGERRRSLPADHPERIRARVRALLAELCPQDDDAFLELVRVGAGDHLLVVALPVGTDLAQVRYGGPLLRAHNPYSRQRVLRGVLRGLVPTGTDFVVDYETTIPRHARSFHVDVEVDPDVTVRSMIMSADDDAVEIEEIVQTLRALGEVEQTWVTRPKLAEHELQAALLRLSSALQRRLADQHLLMTRHKGTRIPWAVRRRLAVWHRLGSALRSLHHSDWPTTRSVLRRLILTTRQQQLGEVPHLVAVPGFGSADGLRRLVDQVERLELRWSALPDNDARDSHGHVHWSPKMSPTRPGAATIRARARMVLADERPALAESVLAMLSGLAVVVYVLGLLDSQHPAWPLHLLTDRVRPQMSGFGQADAVIAVLLVLPGILVSRLDLPRPDTVLGQLRLFPRRVALLAVLITASLGLVIASDLKEGALTLALSAGFWALVGLAGLCLVELVLRAVRRRWFDLPAGPPVPRWLSKAAKPVRVGRHGDAHFAVNTERARPRARFSWWRS